MFLIIFDWSLQFLDNNIFIKSRLDALGASHDVGISDEIIDFCAANGKWFLTLSTLENNNTDILDAMHDFLDR